MSDSERYLIREDDLSGAATRELLALHLAGMHATTPPEHVFALDLTGLQAPGITLWSAWRDARIAGIGALKMLGDRTGEVKSMRTHPAFLRRGAGGAILEHVVATARERGLTRLSLETGRGDAFAPAIALYHRYGFVDGGPFADYVASPFNRFLHLAL